ncbi:hypothetical protein [Lentimicrobium sp.]|uniref:hypothetical protein n=1 Tax=Lentimicrobium sp. TaxID=2034841 RepID=UPI0025D37CA6|nr:hypothetical protein [Lentimicrobium sp.]MCO5256911.1 hypothetical protein [Lentimicrobium sp.]MCO5262142.1 hypothetical protein [Lentimicrobium sp.]HOP14433.1 hypothetical protein [Lentimicrobium sp.]HPF63525.1 hypothetical protein [Lentimicrobium sp.]HPJ61512.1 hypothetical protein [Lentimicrobium sp.]
MRTKLCTISFVMLTMLMITPAMAGTSGVLPLNGLNNTTGTDTAGSLAWAHLKLPQPEPEAYVDDIPFNTLKVSAAYFTSVVVIPETEKTVNDIPFSTEAIASRFMPLDASGIKYENETYVNDIPFDTKRIAARILNCERYRHTSNH